MRATSTRHPYPPRGLLGLGLGCLLLTGCAATSADRLPEAGGPSPDGFADATDVTVWRNADNVPNVAMFCADGLRWAATLSDDGSKSPVLVRVPEHDSRCER
jgi:hypothetical protein